MASSHVPTSCLCIRRDGCGRAALLLVAYSRRPGVSPETTPFAHCDSESSPPITRSPGSSAHAVPNQPQLLRDNSSLPELLRHLTDGSRVGDAVVAGLVDWPT